MDSAEHFEQGEDLPMPDGRDESTVSFPTSNELSDVPSQSGMGPVQLALTNGTVELLSTNISNAETVSTQSMSQDLGPRRSQRTRRLSIEEILVNSALAASRVPIDPLLGYQQGEDLLLMRLEL